VLYVIGLDPSVKFGSLEEQIVMLARAFRERGGLLLPVFDAPLGEAGEIYREAGVEAECLGLHGFEWAKLRRLLGLIRQHRIDVIHWNFYYPFNAYLGWLTLLRPGLRHYLTDHNSRIPGAQARRGRLRGALKNLLLRRYARILCVSEFVRESLRREGAATQLTTCMHFINTDRFHPDPEQRLRLRAELGAENQFVALVVAHLIPDKGVEVLLRALSRLPDAVTAWVVGGGPESERLRRSARDLSLEKRVHFLGNQRHVQPYMQAADCFVCPSLWEEAAGLVNLEALACGLPVVASRIGGIPELVEDGRTGLLFPAGDAEALADGIARLADDRELRQRMSREARSTALECFSVESRIDDYLSFYAEPGGDADVD
jgi:glycosyltransferase involved in cell wall biosynthesis